MENNGKNVLSSALAARNTLPLVCVLMLVLLVAMALGSFSHTRELLRSQAEVERANGVVHEIDSLEDGLQDAREAALHYILTPEKEDLVAFEAAAAQSWVHLDRVAMRTKEDPGYPQRIEQLRGWIDDELRQYRDYMRTTHTLLVFHSAESDFKRDRVRAAIQKLKEDQEKLLRQSNDLASLRTHEVERSVSLLIGGFSGLMAVLFLLVTRSPKKVRHRRADRPAGAMTNAGGFK
jgi:CHASE3 domain sensor protein